MTSSSLPFVSVIIPAYNRAKTIRRCLDTVLAQTTRPHEIIVVDDHSTDETAKIVGEYKNSGVRCLILERHSGAQAARNEGIRKAMGDWIAFQDSDDEWLPDKLEKQVKALAEHSFDPWLVVHTNMFCSNSTERRRFSIELPVVEGNNVYPLLLTKPGPMFQGMLVSRLALDKVNMLDERILSYQEWDTSIRLAKYCKFVYLKEKLFIYNWDAKQTISKKKSLDIAGYRQVMEKFKDEIIKESGQAAWENHLFIQLIKALDYGLWIDADIYFKQINRRNVKYRLFQLYRLLHLTPEPSIRFLNLLRKFLSRGGHYDRKN